jgi:site-specific DNA-cytosine methylase
MKTYADLFCGPGAKTGLYEICVLKNSNTQWEPQIRTLTVKETLRMFGFNDEYKYTSLKNKERMLYYLGNSIVVNVLTEILQHL